MFYCIVFLYLLCLGQLTKYNYFVFYKEQCGNTVMVARSLVNSHNTDPKTEKHEYPFSIPITSTTPAVLFENEGRFQEKKTIFLASTTFDKDPWCQQPKPVDSMITGLATIITTMTKSGTLSADETKELQQTMDAMNEIKRDDQAVCKVCNELMNSISNKKDNGRQVAKAKKAALFAIISQDQPPGLGRGMNPVSPDQQDLNSDEIQISIQPDDEDNNESKEDKPNESKKAKPKEKSYNTLAKELAAHLSDEVYEHIHSMREMPNKWLVWLKRAKVIQKIFYQRNLHRVTQADTSTVPGRREAYVNPYFAALAHKRRPDLYCYAKFGVSNQLKYSSCRELHIH